MPPASAAPGAVPVTTRRMKGSPGTYTSPGALGILRYSAGRITACRSNNLGVRFVKGFRAFITQGNLIALAVAVIIGTAFTALVTAVVSDLIGPLIAAFGGKPNFANLYFTVNHSRFLYGSFVNAVITFLIIAAVVYFLIVAPIAKLTDRMAKKKAATTRDCPECLSTIPIAASRCMYCTAEVGPATVSVGNGNQPG
jgi:large conductance mechanosensitive channel